ncbi:hypothetical protein [Pseudomonas fluorescens]|uniref:hypothetical protein n=1 Tax=Pseudomonas fluorescens TaxID=294 RepID=UPI001249AD42|nr:hypothetical protein [Pseudomonas fluorescens]
MNRIGDNLICFGANEEIVQALVANNVEFAVVGGLAVAWYCPEREADDMDILINPTPQNSERVFHALSGLNIMEINPDSLSKEGVQIQLKNYHYADIITPPKGGPTFDEIISDSIEGHLFNKPIRIPSIAKLIVLKEHTIATAQCSKHLKDIELLRHAV